MFKRIMIILFKSISLIEGRNFKNQALIEGFLVSTS